jgi:hypothetical protein
MTDPTVAAFLAAIDASPRDTAIWAQLADHLDDLGEPEAEGWRWLVAEGKSPIARWLVSFPPQWWRLKGGVPLSNELPARAFGLLEDGDENVDAESARDYPTCSAALADAARAVVKWKGKVTA